MRDFDPARYLVNDEAIAVFLKEAAKEGDKGLLLDCVRDAARAKKINEFAEAHGLDRKTLWNLLEQDAEPQPDALTDLMKAFDVQEAQPVG